MIKKTAIFQKKIYWQNKILSRLRWFHHIYISLSMKHRGIDGESADWMRLSRAISLRAAGFCSPLLHAWMHLSPQFCSKSINYSCLWPSLFYFKCIQKNIFIASGRLPKMPINLNSASYRLPPQSDSTGGENSFLRLAWCGNKSHSDITEKRSKSIRRPVAFDIQ